MPSVPPIPQPSESPASGPFRLVSPEAANTDDVPTIISSRRPHSPADFGDLRGQRLGHFEIIEPVGVGGMAAVLRAQDVNLGRMVALKILPTESATDPEHVTRFHQEARAAALLDHENIARVYYCGEDQGLYFIAFEFVEGQNLRALCESRGPLPPMEAIDLMLQVARGLVHAADRGVIHRDIKPSNVIVTPDGRAKIVDMGLARRLDGLADGVTQSGVTLGTFDYISPEQALEPRTADIRSDIYSLGCTFYHMLTGHPPVPAGTAAMKLHHHHDVQPPDPRESNPQITSQLVAILARTMAKSPEERYQTPLDLVADLESISRRVDKNQSVLPRSTRSVAPANRRGFAIIACTSVLAVAALVALHESLQLPVTSPVEQIFPAPRSAAGNSPAAPAPNIGDPLPCDAGNIDELVTLLKDDTASIRLTGTVYELPPEGLVCAGRRLSIVAADPFAPAIFHFAENEPRERDPVHPLIRIPNGSSVVTIRGVRFDIGSNPNAVATIAAGQFERMTLDRCTWTGGTASIAAAIALETASSSAATRHLVVTNSAFLAPGDAIKIDGPISVAATNVAFLNSRNALVLRESGGSGDTIAKLEQCTARLMNGTCFRFEGGAGGTIQAGHCLFTGETGAALIRQSGQGAGEIEYRSLYGHDGTPLRNAYHGLACWIDEIAGIVAATPEDCLRLKYPFFDADAAELSRPPFRTGVAEQPRDALSPDSASVELRIDPQGIAGLLGAQVGPWGRIGGSPRLPASPARNKVIDPSRETNSSQGVYRTLAQALPDIRADDTILIKSNEPLAVSGVRLEQSDLRLTIAPFPGYRPTLTLAANSDPQPAQFQLRDGALTFRDIQFRLKPSLGDVRHKCIAAVTGNGSCSFMNCVVTLEDSNEDRASVVTLPESNGRSGERQDRPKLRFNNCFVRGKGDLVNARSSAGFDLELDNVLAALDGTVAIIETANKESTSAMIRLQHVTTFATEHFLDLRSDHNAATFSVQVAAADSLIIAAPSRAVFRLDGIENEDDLRQVFHWMPGKNVLFANCSTVIAGMAHGKDQPAMSVNPARWRTLGFENASANPFVRVRLTAANGERSLARAHPFELRTRLLDSGNVSELNAGANLERLPRLDNLESSAKPADER